jgi:hypothetical protein
LRSIKETWGAKVWRDTLFVANEKDGNPGGAKILDEKLITPPADIMHSDTRKRIWAFAQVLKSWPRHEWIAFSNDNVYFVEENLREYLGTLNPKKPHFLGSKLSPNSATTFNSASVIVLSAPALKTLVRRCGNLGADVNAYVQAYDLQVAACLSMKDKQPAILPADTRDPIDKGERFMMYNPVRSANGVYDDWFKQYKAGQGGTQSGTACCSTHPIAMHYVEAEEAKLLHAILFARRAEKGLELEARQKWQDW